MAANSMAGTGQGPFVLSRLQALFGPTSPITQSRQDGSSRWGGSRDGVGPSVDAPAGISRIGPILESRASDSSESGKGKQKQAKAVKDRQALKIKVVTWNMGDALPKGDLSVLLGTVPDYVPLPVEDGIPLMPIADLHPYHIVVVAGQECPTESGVPRGLGGGVIRGMKLGQQHKRDKEKEKEKKDKDKDQEKIREEEEKEALEHLDNSDAGHGHEYEYGHGREPIKDKEKGQSSLDVPTPSTGTGPGQDKHSHLLSPFAMDDGESSESAEASRSTSPAISHTPSLHRHQHAPGAKGWSTMLDDWLCGSSNRPLAKDTSREDGKEFKVLPKPDQAPLTIPSLPIRRESLSLSTPTSPILSPTFSQLRVESPGMIRSSTSPLNVPTIAQLGGSYSHSPLALVRSPGSFSSLASKSGSETSNSELDLDLASGTSHSHGQPVTPSLPGASLLAMGPSTASPQKAASYKPERPTLVIPDDAENSVVGTKCYLHLVKERLMGMYLSIYVHRDCKGLIGGMDKDFVTTGLAGGRLGNKGGILKVADHRFLFVNSHLAAHTARNAARMSNIAKIKEELRLNCFLPKTDPRAELPDIADRFDTVFWCGDLNFRLDVSRLHAEWLVERKKYDEALTFDQLRVAMADPDKSPFPGFEEGPINFPPTFKYDVWKSARATNKELRKSLKRRGSVKDKAPPDLSKSGGTTLDHVPETRAEEMEHEAQDRVRDSDEETIAMDPSRQSMESSRSMRIVSDPRSFSTAMSTEAEDDMDDMDDVYRRDEATRNGMLNSHRPLDVAIKEKTKKVFSLVKLKTALTPSPHRKGFNFGRDRLESPVPTVPPPTSSGMGHSFTVTSRNQNQGSHGEFDASSRRTSLSSLASMREGINEHGSPREVSGQVPHSGYKQHMISRPEGAQSLDEPRTPLNAHPPTMFGSPSSLNEARTRRPTVGSQAGPDIQVSPPRARSFSLKRTMSGRSAKFGSSVGSSVGQLGDMSEDRREGVYDSSKKQRVPSWCDRVLWKAHPELESDSESESEHDVDVQDDTLPRDTGKLRPFGRLSVALHTLGGQLKHQISRSPSIPVEPGTISRIGSSTGLDRIKTTPANVGYASKDSSFAPTLVDSPISKLADSPKSTDMVVSSLARPRSRSPRAIRTVSDMQEASRGGQRRGSRGRAQTYDVSSDGKSTSGGHRHPLLAVDAGKRKSRATHSQAEIDLESPISPSRADSAARPALPHITFEPAASPTADRAPSSALLPISGEKSTFRARANSDCHDTSARARLASSIGLGAPIGMEGAKSAMKTSPSFPPRRTTDELLLRPSDRTAPDTFSGYNASAPTNSRVTPVSLHDEGGDRNPTASFVSSSHASSPVVVPAEERGAFARFIKEIPTWLHRHTNSNLLATEAAALEVEAAEERAKLEREHEGQVIRIKRHRKGEVVCLGYGTIDDAGMRLLEGRSGQRLGLISQ